jgi:hypothetical protein
MSDAAAFLPPCFRVLQDAFALLPGFASPLEGRHNISLPQFGNPVRLIRNENRIIRSGFDHRPERRDATPQLRHYATTRKWNIYAE